MNGLFANARFTGFGPDPLRPHVDAPNFEQVSGRRRSDLRKTVRLHCPKLPGVYGMLDQRGRLIYVGKAKSLRNRLLSYFLAANRNLKAGRIIKRARVIVWEPGPCEFAALVRELELIRRWKPSCNVQGIPGHERQIYVCLGRAPAPYLFVTRQPTGKEIACYGPVKGAARASQAARWLNDLFKLRDCAQTQAMHFSEQQELFPILHTAGCLRYELNTCLGPCAAFTSRSNYSRHVRSLRAFLEGRDPGPLAKLEAEMTAASERLDFERAAMLRDKITPMCWLRDRLGWVDEARQKHSCVYPQTTADGTTVWYLIRRGRVHTAVAAPTSPETGRIAVEALTRIFDDPKSWPNLVPVHLVDHVLLVAAWFRNRPEEEKKALRPAEALAVCLAAARQSSLVRAT